MDEQLDRIRVRVRVRAGVRLTVSTKKQRGSSSYVRSVPLTRSSFLPKLHRLCPCTVIAVPPSVGEPGLGLGLG